MLLQFASTLAKRRVQYAHEELPATTGLAEKQNASTARSGCACVCACVRDPELLSGAGVKRRPPSRCRSGGQNSSLQTPGSWKEGCCCSLASSAGSKYARYSHRAWHITLPTAGHTVCASARSRKRRLGASHSREKSAAVSFFLQVARKRRGGRFSSPLTSGRADYYKPRRQSENLNSGVVLPSFLRPSPASVRCLPVSS